MPETVELAERYVLVRTPDELTTPEKKTELASLVTAYDGESYDSNATMRLVSLLVIDDYPEPDDVSDMSVPEADHIIKTALGRYDDA